MTHILDAALAALLSLLSKLPSDRAFTSAEAVGRGVRPEHLRRLVQSGLLRHPIRRVYIPAALEDNVGRRVEALGLVVPEDCVVTDRTAAWLWGAEMVLAPGDHLVTPRVSVFAPPGRRLRNDLTTSGERRLPIRDVVELNGVLVTTPLRTACDLGRLLHRDQALAAMDALTALGDFTVAHLCVELERFRGYRGIIQARVLTPLVDPGAGSPGESVLRLRWVDAGLPTPECQIEIPAPGGSYYRLDLGHRDSKFGAEYDGEQFHGPEQAARDAARREWAREHEAGRSWWLARRTSTADIRTSKRSSDVSTPPAVR